MGVITKTKMIFLFVIPSLVVFGDLCDESSDEMLTDPDYLNCLGDWDPEMHIPLEDRRTRQECEDIWAKKNSCGEYTKDNPPPPYDFSDREPYREPPLH